MWFLHGVLALGFSSSPGHGYCWRYYYSMKSWSIEYNNIHILGCRAMKVGRKWRLYVLERDHVIWEIQTAISLIIRCNRLGTRLPVDPCAHHYYDVRVFTASCHIIIFILYLVQYWDALLLDQPTSLSNLLSQDIPHMWLWTSFASLIPAQSDM